MRITSRIMMQIMMCSIRTIKKKLSVLLATAILLFSTACGKGQSMTLLDHYYNLDTDLSPIGLLGRADNEGYSCTPLGAQIIDWTGVDGIHYCFVEGFGEMVFAVNPSSGMDFPAYPVAENFADFLGLLLTAKSEAAIEQIVQWDREQYDAYVQEESYQTYAAEPEVQNALAAIASLGVEPVKDPFGYVKQIQREFDYTKLRFSDTYYEEIGLKDHTNGVEFDSWKVSVKGYAE